MKSKNEYWNLSGWHIFDFLDRKAHNHAKAFFQGDCVTSEWTIRYKNPLKRISNKLLRLERKEISQNRILITTTLSYEITTWEIIIFAQATFTFVKI